MKIISFKIPKTQKDAYHFQVDRLNRFYDKLHQHPEIQFTYIHKGSGTLIVGDYIGKFSPGEVFVIGSSLPHVFRNDVDNVYNNRKEQAVGFSLYVDTEVWKNSFWAAKETMTVGRFLQRFYSAYKVEGKLKNIMANELQHLETLQGYERLLGMLELMYEVYKNRRNLQLISGGKHWRTMQEHDGMRMSDIIRFTLEECDRAISLAEVASVANMTVEAFCRYFKMHTRKTYVSFLNEVRINNACKMLLEGDYSKSEIAYRSGFNNLSHFNRTFKRITGKTPGEYVNTYEIG